MGRATSAPPAGNQAPGRDDAPAWFDEVVSGDRRLDQTQAPSVRRRDPQRVDITAVHAAPLVTPSGAPLRHAGLIDFINVGAEQRGRYTLTSPDGERGAELGRGGIGRVLVIMDEHLGREVAIKELLDDEAAGGCADPEMATRFLAEARITGQLEHPNIVPVYELGRRLDGRLYYTMRVVRGETMTTALSRASTLGDRLALLPHFAGLCHAIEYAHSRGVVHRDIKPDNVMIGEFGETVVLDWGIAKLRDQPEQAGARRPRGVALVGETARGDVVGTPLYMSPEQARGSVDEIDEASDIWSLGVVLYVLLSGRLPFTGKTPDEVVQKVQQGRLVPVHIREPRAPLELSAIVKRALQRDKLRRYSSVRELVRDVEAFMSGARVAAYDYTALELFRRFYRKHRAAAIVGAVALVSLLVVATGLQQRILSARDRALSAERIALDKERAARESLSEVFAERALSASNEGDVFGAGLYGARALSLGERPDARGSIVSETNQTQVSPLSTVPELAHCTLMAAARSGQLVCARGRDLLFWTPTAPLVTWTVGEPPRTLSVSGDGQVALAAFEEGRLVSYETSTGRVRSAREVTSGAPQDLTLSDDGGRFLTTTSAGWVQIFETGSAQLVARVRLDEPISASEFSHDGRQVLLGGRLGAVTHWIPGVEPPRVVRGHRGTVTAVAFSPHADRFATAGSDRALSLWATATLDRTTSPAKELGTVHSLAWSDNGRMLVLGSDDRMLGLIDTHHPRHVQRFRGHQGPVVLARFAGPDRLVSASARGAPRVWSTRGSPLPRQLSHRGNVLAQSFVSPGLLATAGLAQHGVCLWAISEERCKTRLPVRDGQVRALSVGLSGTRLALGTSTGRLVMWNLDTALPERVLAGHSKAVRSVEFSADGRLLLSASRDGTATLWDTTTGLATTELSAAAPINAALFDAERSRIIIGTRAGALEEWSLAGERRRSVLTLSDWVMDLARHAERDLLVAAGDDGRLSFWKLSSLTRLGEVSAHQGRALSVDLSPDGRLVASAGEDGLVTIWLASERRLLARLPHHRGAARSVRFAPDGRFVVSGGDDGSVRLWDLSLIEVSGDSLLHRIERLSQARLSGAKVELLDPDTAAQAPRLP